MGLETYEGLGYLIAKQYKFEIHHVLHSLYCIESYFFIGNGWIEKEECLAGFHGCPLVESGVGLEDLLVVCPVDRKHVVEELV